MAALLKCDICGGTLEGKPGGVFECDSCGMRYSTEWAKAKIQEIRGTVKVEGTVEVTGKVQVAGGTVTVEGAANKDSLLKRGFMALEESKWEDAKGFFDEALNADAECAEAYLGLLLAELKLRNRQALAKCWQLYSENPNYQKALRFGDAKLKNELEGYLFSGINAHIQEKAENKDRREREKAESRASLQTVLNKEKTDLQAELASLKGLFSGKRRKEIESRLAQIERELNNL